MKEECLKMVELGLTFFILIIFGSINVLANPLSHLSGSGPQVDTIENFDDGVIQLQSYSNQDINPTMWSLENTITYHNSPHSLKLYGNTWKLEVISPMTVDTGDVWQVSNYIQQVAEIQGFGITDSVNTLLYSFAGIEEVNPDEWITVYQGAFPNNQWNVFQLPIADDWLAKFGYLPTVKGIIFINDRDYTSQGISYFDEILDITNSLPVSPQVGISYTLGKLYRNRDGITSVDVQFTSNLYDPDGGEHNYLWDFGDDSTSTEPNPSHTFLVEDDHDYTVLLDVVDETGLNGRASCQIDVDPGPTTFPITMNFVGDVMLARRIDNFIDLHGYEPIFDPTHSALGEAADITVANLECALTNQGTPHPTKSVVFRGSPENVAALTYAGIDAVTIANNHIIDYGLPGLQQTKLVVESEEILLFGAGTDSYEAMQPAFYLKSGVNFAFLGSSDRTGQYNNEQPYLNAGYNKPGFANLTESNVIEQINSVRNIADLVICEMHSGSEYSIVPVDLLGKMLVDEDPDADEDYSADLRAPLESDIEMRHFTIDHGADLVLCHHPHIIQGVEVYKKKLIAHSLGNFVFDLDYPETFPSMIINAKIDESGFYEYSITPVYIDDYIPVRARGELGLYLLDDLAQRSKELNSYLIVDRDNVTADIVLDTTKLIRYSASYTGELNMEEKNGLWISKPVLLARNGSISSVDNVTPPGSWQYRLGRQLIWFGNFEDEGCTLWEINNANEFYDTSEAFTGLRSFCQKRASGLGVLYTDLEKRIKLYSNVSGYTLAAYVKTDNSKNTTINLQCFETRTQVNPIGVENLGTQVNGTTGWTFYHNDFTVPANTGFINVRLQSESPQTGTGNSWFDNVGLIEWTDWKDCNSAPNISYPNDYYWIQFKTNVQVVNANANYTETNFMENVNPANITVQSPNGGEVWIIGENENITWLGQNVNDVMIELSTNNGASWITIESSVPNTGTYTWTVVAPDPSNECLIRVTDIDDNMIKDISDGLFAIDTLLITSFQLSVSVSNGWNCVSVPGINPDGQGVNNWWINHGGFVYKFDPDSGYIPVIITSPGEGYWMKNNSNQTYNTGDEWPASGIEIVTHDAINAAQGWNMLGGYEDIVDPAALATIPAGMIVYPIYKYVPGSGYGSAAQIVPGYGYWVKVSGACQIIVPDATAMSNQKIAEMLKDDLPNKAGWGEIILTDATGSSYTLYAVKGPVDLTQYELPPVPPEGIFDIRFGSGRVAENIDTGFKSIVMRAITYPVRIKVENMGIRLKDVTEKLINTNIKEGEEITIDNPGIDKVIVSKQFLPTQFSLEQNFPNPFNPVTSIRFSIPKETAVNLSIYNLLGERVKELKNEVMRPGYYELEFDATALASGVYFYRISAGDFIQTKKMMLTK